MKALLRFLLHTGVGREIVRAIVGLAIRLFKDKVLNKLEPYKRENLKEALDIADKELHADIDSGKLEIRV